MCHDPGLQIDEDVVKKKVVCLPPVRCRGGGPAKTEIAVAGIAGTDVGTEIWMILRSKAVLQSAAYFELRSNSV
jgi:hypothetical protein